MNFKYDTKKLRDICETNDIVYLGLFGFYTADQEQDDSDVDLLVDFSNTKSLFGKGGFLLSFKICLTRKLI